MKNEICHSTKKATYARWVADIREQKEETHRVRMTAGGNLLEGTYKGETSTETAAINTVKIHTNHIISSPGAKCLATDIGNMYLNTVLDSPEYIRIHITMIPDEILEDYNINNEYIDENGFVYFEITKAIYGLAQSGRLAHDDLKQHLAKYGYYPNKRTHGLWRHRTKRTTFTLVVDDFQVCYFSKEDANHLLNALTDKYPIKTDWKGEKYIGIDFDWNYKKGEVILSMKGYVKKALQELKFIPNNNNKMVHGPTLYTPPSYGKKIQYEPEDFSPELNKTEINFIQQVTGKFGYPSRCVDNTMQHALNELCIAATTGTEQTMKELVHFLNYCSSNPDASIIYRKSDMILAIDSDAAYLVAPKARSRAGGYHYLGNKDGNLFNGPVHIIAKVIKAVMSAASEAECGAAFINAQDAVPTRITLEELNWKQPPTPLKTDNNTASGIMNKTVKQRKSKTMDMRFYWLQDRVQQGMFRVYWGPGIENLADYFTKKHPPSHHKKVRPIYLYQKDLSPTSLQGCVKILGAPKKQRASNYNNNSNAKAQANSHVLPDSNIVKLYQRAIDTNSKLAPIAVAALIRLSNR